jgi:hypothetical protein
MAVNLKNTICYVVMNAAGKIVSARPADYCRCNFAQMPHRGHFCTNAPNLRVYGLLQLDDDGPWRYRPLTHGRLTDFSSPKNPLYPRFGGPPFIWIRA